MLRIVIGMVNYTGAACGLSFEQSVAQNVPEDWTEDHVQVRRLLALFPGTTAEEVKRSPTIGEDDQKVKAELQAALETDAAVAKTSVKPEEPKKDETGDTPLVPGDEVLAHYKDEFRHGEVVKILESGAVHVKIDGDDAQYRVLDGENVSRLDPSAAQPEAAKKE